jgi:hypothetical protein
MSKVIRSIVYVFIILHGLAHLMATSVYWQLTESPDLVYDTAVLGGRVDLGENGIWLYGLLWLIAGLGTALAGIALFTRAAWAKPLLLAVTVFSLALCVLVIEAAKVGILINLAILAALLPGLRTSGLRSRLTSQRGVGS